MRMLAMAAIALMFSAAAHAEEWLKPYGNMVAGAKLYGAQSATDEWLYGTVLCMASRGGPLVRKKNGALRIMDIGAPATSVLLANLWIRASDQALKARELHSCEHAIEVKAENWR